VAASADIDFYAALRYVSYWCAAYGEWMVSHPTTNSAPSPTIAPLFAGTHGGFEGPRLRGNLRKTLGEKGLGRMGEYREWGKNYAKVQTKTK